MQRYDWDGHGMDEVDIGGDYVRYEDAAALEAENAALREKLAAAEARTVLTDDEIYQFYRRLDLPHAPVMWTAALGTVRAILANSAAPAAKCEGCNGHGMVGNILDSDTCPFCHGSGHAAPAGPFAHFKQDSSFGPFIECRADDPGAFKAYLAAPAAQEDARGWVSVKERLPELGVLVLVYSPPTGNSRLGEVNISMDYLDADCDGSLWYHHSEHYEHFCCVAKSPDIPMTGPGPDAPYSHWAAIPTIDTAIAANTPRGT